jgi:hypothetical protein
MKPPCKDCLTLAICKGKVGTISQLEIDDCPLVSKYINSEEMLSKRPMYRDSRINKIRVIFGFKKKEGKH